jgi:ArsR family transcriptional regulator
MPALSDTLDALALLGDATRLRLARVLTAHELSVAELVEVLGVAQSRVSSHLTRLREAGLLRVRRVGGGAALHAVDPTGAAPALRELWNAAVTAMNDPQLLADEARAAALVRAREQRFPEAFAGEMERHYSPGRTWEAMAHALVATARLGDVLDAGGGDGSVAELLAPSCRSLTLLDASAPMVEAARRRLQGRVRTADGGSPRVLLGDVERMALPDASFDLVLLLHVLVHCRRPALAVRQCARVLRPGGRLVVATLDAHPHADLARAYGHVHTGLAAEALQGMLERAGLEVRRCERALHERRAPRLGVVVAAADAPQRGAEPATHRRGRAGAEVARGKGIAGRAQASADAAADAWAPIARARARSGTRPPDAAIPKPHENLR